MKHLSPIHPVAESNDLHFSQKKPASRNDSSLACRLLQHHTKKVLQRIVKQCESTELLNIPTRTALAEDVERRTMLWAKISDALFSVTPTPDCFECQFKSLVKATVALLSDGSQVIDIRINIIGRSPEAVIPVTLQVARELVGNAVMRGLHMRVLGAIFVSLHTSAEGKVKLMVSDDGWDPGVVKEAGGASIIAEYVTQHGGSVSLMRRGGQTVAAILIPPTAPTKLSALLADCDANFAGSERLGSAANTVMSFKAIVRRRLKSRFPPL